MADLNKYLFNLCLTEIKRMFICNEKYFQSCILSLLTMFYSLFEDPKVKFENVIKIPVYDNYRMVLVFPSSPFPPPTYTCNLKVSFGRICMCKDLLSRKNQFLVEEYTRLEIVLKLPFGQVKQNLF